MEAMNCYFPLDAHLYVYGGGGIDRLFFWKLSFFLLIWIIV